MQVFKRIMACLLRIYYCSKIHQGWHIQLDWEEPLQMVWCKRPVYDTVTGCKKKICKLIMAAKKTLVIGASENPARYSNLAVNRLTANNHPVIALGKKAGNIGSTVIETEKKSFENIDTVTLYLNPRRQQEYYDYILSLKPRRIIFNPGAENDELAELAQKNGIIPQEACTLVLLSTGQY